MSLDQLDQRVTAPQRMGNSPAKRRRQRTMRTRHGASRKLTVTITIALLAGGLLTAFPLIWMLTGSFKPQREALDFPPSLLPDEPTLANYVRLFTEMDFGRYLFNTIALVAISAIGLVFMAMAGYAFAKYRFRGKEPMFFLVLATLMVPVQVTMIPTYLILAKSSLTNTLIGMALPTLVSGFGIFLFRQFMSTIPDELLEAARLDGASEYRIFWRIVMPMSGPILAVQAVLVFIGSWNSFLWPLIIASDQNLYTLSVGIALLNQQIAVDPALQMAGASLMVMPVLIVFLFFQRYVVQGFTMSGLK